MLLVFPIKATNDAGDFIIICPGVTAYVCWL